MYHTFTVQCKVYFQHSILSNILYSFNFFFFFCTQLNKKKERSEQNIYKAKITKQKKKKNIIQASYPPPCHKLNFLHHLFTTSRH